MSELPPPVEPIEPAAPNAALTPEQEPVTRIQDPEKAYYMGHAMVANMDHALSHRQTAKDALDRSYAFEYNGVPQVSGQAKHDKNTVYAIQYEDQADVQAANAQETFDMRENGQDTATRAEGAKRLDSLTRENRPAGYVEPINKGELHKFKPLLEKDAAKKLALEDLHKALDGNNEVEATATGDNEAEFLQESQRILTESMPVKAEADKLAKLFASGSNLEANSAAAKTMEQAARASTGIIRMGLSEYFNPARIAEWEKKGSLTNARAEINGQLRSIALSAMLGKITGDKFTPEPLDLFNDPQGVSYALEDIARHAIGPKILAVAQKSMKLLSALQGYESIVSPAGKDLAPLENGLKRISAFLDAASKPSQSQAKPNETERPRIQDRQPMSNEELRRRGRRPTNS